MRGMQINHWLLSLAVKPSCLLLKANQENLQVSVEYCLAHPGLGDLLDSSVQC